MKIRNIEKKIYEILGVNIFRKYVLFTWDKLWKPIGGAPGYRIKNNTINDIEEYKTTAKGFAYVHFWISIDIIGLYFFHCIPKSSLILHLILNPYCIMTQRYTCIRINEILEKYKELEKRKSENANNSTNEENFDYDLNYTNQPEKVENYEQIPTSIEAYYCSKSLETLEQTGSNFGDDVPRLLKK